MSDLQGSYSAHYMKVDKYKKCKCGVVTANALVWHYPLTNKHVEIPLCNQCREQIVKDFKSV